MARVVCDQGMESVRVEHVIATAGVSRSTFYSVFSSLEECLLATCEQGLALGTRRARSACQPTQAWQQRIRMGLHALLEFLDEEPELARVCIVHSPAAGAEAIIRGAETLKALAAVLDEGRVLARRQPSPVTAEGLVGGALAVIHARLLRPQRQAMADLLNPLMSFLVLPYLGASAARRELQQP
jgi:AcrR family transcriptional regulator